MHQARGNFIDGRWRQPSDGDLLRSVNPATEDTLVLEALSCPDDASVAVSAAATAQRSWAALPLTERLNGLARFAG
ncbi:MAG: aldehyde dehydrogenase family protein, partial [Myxococcota bacterium]|nr:aldehyde dehydrogenase family protein [Myxococcota bacterium]